MKDSTSTGASTHTGFCLCRHDGSCIVDHCPRHSSGRAFPVAVGAALVGVAGNTICIRTNKHGVVIFRHPETSPGLGKCATTSLAMPRCLMRYANTLRISLLAGGSANGFAGSSVRSPAEGYAVPSSPPSSIVTASG